MKILKIESETEEVRREAKERFMAMKFTSSLVHGLKGKGKVLGNQLMNNYFAFVVSLTCAFCNAIDHLPFTTKVKSKRKGFYLQEMLKQVQHDRSERLKAKTKVLYWRSTVICPLSTSYQPFLYFQLDLKT